MQRFMLFRIRVQVLALLALFLCCAAPAQAAVTISFYSHAFRFMDGLRTDFPHGFVTLTGTTTDGTPVNTHLGFSAKNIFIDVLWRPTDGALDDEALTDAYVADAMRHFAFTISDAQYRAVMAVEHSWRTWPQPSYDIDTHNCVTFVKEIAIAAGLSVSEDKKFVRDPKAFILDLKTRNAALLGDAPAATPVAASLQDRVQQLEQQSAAVKAGQ
jgi:hypothetical protein